MQIEYIGKREKLKVTFTRFPYTFRPGEATEVGDPDDQQTLLAHPTSFVRVTLPEGAVDENVTETGPPRAKAGAKKKASVKKGARQPKTTPSAAEDLTDPVTGG